MDDRAEDNCSLAELVGLFNYETFCATSQEEAVRLLQEKGIDAAVISIDSPINGFQIAQHIKGLDDYKDLPLAFTTSQDYDYPTLMEAQYYGGMFLHRKPYDDVEVLATLSSMVRVKMLQDELKERMQELDHLASTDVLTGIYNRRMFFIRVAEEMARARRNQSPYCVLYMDIDHFKGINDTHGHLAGDFILRSFAQLVDQAKRKSDVFGRIGGEEFVILLPDAGYDEGQMIAERIRATIEETDINWVGKAIPVTISVGMLAIPENAVATADELMKIADEALYEAKESGRNRVVSRELEIGDAVARPFGFL
ncbi:diguanylate cyclase [bacterium]|nr:diguanylate cyclase [bacterium]